MRPLRLVIKLCGGGARLMRNRRAATAIEYGLIAAVIVVAMIASFRLLADVTVGMWGNVSTKVAGTPGN